MEKTRGDDGKPKWYWWLLAIFLFLIGMVVVGWMLNRNARELAKLRHEKEKARILRDQEDARLAAEVHHEAKEDALRRVTQAQATLDAVEAHIEKVKEQHAIDNNAAMRLRWSDLPRAEG